MKKIGIYSGSFNPIHHGHLMLASYLVTFGELDELWLLVSPQNPLKPKAELLDDQHRLEMARLAVGDDPFIKVSDVEMHLPRPSYTINTLQHLSEQYPDNQFVFVCGMDSLQNLDKWKDYEKILNNYNIIVFPRKGYDGGELINHPSVRVVETPIIELSSTFIRNCIADNISVRHFMPENAYNYLTNNNLYKNN